MLNAYGISLSAAKLMKSYLCNRKQKTKINTAYSSWEEILFGVSQRSILGPLLFNIFLCDLFLIMNKVDFSSYADDNTSYVIVNGIKKAINSLKEASDKLSYWFANNQMKANPDKCHLLTSSSDKVSICVDNCNIKSSKCEKLLGIKIDIKLNFNTHVDEICKKAGQKLNALSRVTPYMDLSKRCLLLNAFFISQFSYCPLVWMFHSRGKNNKINRIHERCLRIIYNDKKSTFYELLEKDGSVSIHKRNLRFLACEMFKLKRDMAPELIKELILPNRQRRYELRNNPDFAVPIVKSVHKGLESLNYLGPTI